MKCVSFKLFLFIIISFSSIIIGNAQNLVWTGAAGDLSFFNEVNWRNTATGNAPTAGTINPGVAINAALLIQNATGVIGSSSGISSDILFGTGNLIIRKSTLKMAAGKGIDMAKATNTLTIDSALVSADFINNATTSITGDSRLYLLSTNPFNSTSTINIASNDAWIFASNLNASTALSSYVSRVKVNGSALVDMTNGRLSQYYNGCAMSAYTSSLAPLRVFDASNLNGTYADIPVQTIFSGNSIPSNLNNGIVSFKLKKGYMATLSVGDDGTGMSKVYIASESDLVVNALPPALSGQISFIRVVPWIWVNKKGTGKYIANPKVSWFYDWGLSNSSLMDEEYATMCWGKTGLDTPAEQNSLINKKKITHIMSFNEADDCNGQSGQWGSLCVPDTAALWHRYSMKTGLRIVSPSCREHEENAWLKTVNTILVPAGTRMDVIGMHWYDWEGLNSTSDANSIFTRFKNRVVACYNYYKMPIWIDEFNANPARSTAIQDGFLQLALPWLESTPYVERYAYFQPSSSTGNYLDANGNLTSTGTIYLNQVSTPSIPENYVNYYNNNLQSRMNETPLITSMIEKNNRLQYQYNSTTNQIFVKTEVVNPVKLYNLHGVCLKLISSNANTILAGIPSGIYILSSSGFRPEKISVY
ncbi:MAG: glycosyl hydrolase [Bacteroidales bacterium]